MNIAEVKSYIEKTLPGTKLTIVRDSLLIENPADLPRVAGLLKESDTYRVDYLASITGADYLQYLECVYHLFSMERKIGPVILRARTNRENPSVPSLVPIYRGAEYQEREIFDLFGIFFEGHPDLRRILMWEGLNASPMRKDYQQEDREKLSAEDIRWLDEHGVSVPPEFRESQQG